MLGQMKKKKTRWSKCVNCLDSREHKSHVFPFLLFENNYGSLQIGNEDFEKLLRLTNCDLGSIGRIKA